MSKLIFTDNQIKMLEKNAFVKRIPNSTIEFTFEFKEHIVLECDTFQKAIAFFELNNLGQDVLGHKRIEQCFYRWKKQFREHGNVPFILETRGRGRKKPIEQTKLFNKLSPQEKVDVLLKQREQDMEEINLLKKYMPSLDGSKVKQDK